MRALLVLLVLTLSPAAGPGRAAIVWTQCDWVPNSGDELAECATVPMPLDHARPTAGDIHLLVKRRVARSTARAAVWLVHGGPGAAATAGMADLSHGIAELRDDISFYAVDHRGVGGSAPLRCPKAEEVGSPGGVAIVGSEWPSCLHHVRQTHGPQLAHFSTDAAARDLAQLIAATRSDVPVFVYGASYGTYLVRRYLALTTASPDGVILEGLVAADRGMMGYDARQITRSLAFLATCDAAPACAQHFEAPLAEETANLLTALEGGHCRSVGLDASTFKQLLAVMTFSHDSRVLVPALVHRVKRCRWSDVLFLWRLSRRTAQLDTQAGYAPVLHHHVVLSEMYRPGASAAALTAQFERAVIATGIEATYAGLYPHWPRYQPPATKGVTFDGPVLALQGGLDVASPVTQARLAFAAFTGPHQHLVVFPWGAHGVTGSTPGLDGADCARRILLNFIDAPRIAPDKRCIAGIRPLDWQHIPAGTRAIAGYGSLWDG